MIYLKCNLCESENFKFIHKGNINHSEVERFSQYTFFGDIYKCDSCNLVVKKPDHNTTDYHSNIAVTSNIKIIQLLKNWTDLMIQLHPVWTLGLLLWFVLLLSGCQQQETTPEAPPQPAALTWPEYVEKVAGQRSSLGVAELPITMQQWSQNIENR